MRSKLRNTLRGRGISYRDAVLQRGGGGLSSYRFLTFTIGKKTRTKSNIVHPYFFVCIPYSYVSMLSEAYIENEIRPSIIETKTRDVTIINEALGEEKAFLSSNV